MLVSLFKRGSNDDLLEGFVRYVGERRVRMFSGVNVFGDRVHLVANRFILTFGTRLDLLAPHWRIEREAELDVVELCANAKIARGFWQQFFLEPGLVIGDGVFRRFDCCLKTCTVCGGQSGHLGNDHRFDNRI